MARQLREVGPVRRRGMREEYARMSISLLPHQKEAVVRAAQEAAVSDSWMLRSIVQRWIDNNNRKGGRSK